MWCTVLLGGNVVDDIFFKKYAVRYCCGKLWCTIILPEIAMNDIIFRRYKRKRKHNHIRNIENAYQHIIETLNYNNKTSLTLQ